MPNIYMTLLDLIGKIPLPELLFPDTGERYLSTALFAD